MEEWQKSVILDKLSELIKDIHCNVELLSHLLQRRVLSAVDVDVINASGKDGDFAKNKKLLEVLETRKRGFESLAIALHKTSQSGALLLLLEEAEQNVHDKSAFQACDIEINCDEVLSKSVMFEGAKVNLKELCSTIDSGRLQNIITSCMNVDMYKKLIYSSNNSIPTLVSNTVPEPISYYIARTITLKSRLDPSIFHRLENDVFLLEGIQLHQLTMLANMPIRTCGLASYEESDDAYISVSSQSNMYTQLREPMTGNWSQATRTELKVRTDTSSNQIHDLNVRFILLEKEAHFNKIVALSKSPVHWIKYENESYVYIKSNQNGGTSRVQEFLRQSADEHLSEEDFLDMSLRRPRSHAYLIYESPGMGKTILLAEFARKVKAMSPQGNTVFISASRLISMYDKSTELREEVFRDKLAKCITNNKLGLQVQLELFRSNKHSIHLFVDGFDEIPKLDINHAQNIISFILNSMKNFRLYVTTRPHYRAELEDLFGVSGYNILPFHEDNQILFFTSFWNKEHGIPVTEVVSDFAKTCIQTFNSTVSVKDRSLAGIPLQCKMLAELYLDEARDEIPTFDERHSIKSVYKMYKQYIDLKFETCKYKPERKALYYFHVVSAINLIFPKKLNITRPAFTEKVYCIGIMEKCRSFPNKSVFVHRSFAEFLASDAILTWCQGQLPNTIDSIMLTEFFVNDLFQTINAFELILKHLGGKKIRNWPNQFYHATLPRFFEIGYAENKLRKKSLVNIQHQDKAATCDLKTLLRLFEASIFIDSITLLKLFIELFLPADFFQSDGVTREDFGESIKYLVTYSCEFASVNLVKYVCECLYKVSSKYFYEFEYAREDSPVYNALQKGNYHVAEYLLIHSSPAYFNTFYPLNAIMTDTYYKKAAVIKQKQQIIELLLSNYPENFNINSEYILEAEFIPSPLLSKGSHLNLLKVLIKNGANLLVKHVFDMNVLHLVSEYFSPENFEKFIKLLFDFDKGKASSLFDMCDSTKRKTSPIHKAVGHIELHFTTLELLHTQNVKLDIIDGEKRNILHQAVLAKRSVSFLKFIIDKGYCALESQDCDGSTFLHYLPAYYSESDYIEILEHLIHLGRQDIFHIQNNELCLPIHIAVEYYEISKKTLHLFQTHSVDFNSINIHDYSLLMMAADGKKSLSTLKTLLSFGVNIMAINSKGFNTAHFVAFEYSAKEFHDFAELVLSLPNDKYQPKQIFEIRDKTKFKSTAIHIAVEKIELYSSSLELLHTHNVKLDIVSGKKLSILQYAVAGKRSLSFLKFIIENEYCSLASQDCDGNTFLHDLPTFYSESDYIAILEHLIHLGRQDIFHIRNHKLWLPIHFAFHNYEISEKTLNLFQTHSVDFNAVDQNGNSLLMVAAYGKKSLSTLRTLVSFGVDIMTPNSEGFNIAHIVAFESSAKKFRDFVEFVLSLSTGDTQPKQIFEIRDKTEFESTPVHIAVETIELHPSTLELLHTHNVRLDIIDGKKRTILHRAVIGKRSISFLKFIIEKGYCPLESQDCDGHTFLHSLPDFYSESDYIEILEHLVRLGRQDIFHIRNILLCLPIHFAVHIYEISEKTLNLFQTHSVDFNAVDQNGNSLLMVAAYGKKSLSTLKTLVSFGVDIMAQDSEGFNVAHIVATKYSAEEFHDFVEFVLSLATVDTQPKQIFEIRGKTEFESTAIHIAVEYIELQFSTLELLHTHNVKLNMVDGEKQTILHRAIVGKRSVSFLKIIIDKRYCPLESQDCTGSTFLHYLPYYYNESEYFEILDFLVKTKTGDILNNALFKVANNKGQTPLHTVVLEHEVLPETLDVFCDKMVPTAHDDKSNECSDIINSLCDINALTHDSSLVLFYAIKGKRSLNLVKELISRGADWKHRTNHNATALLLAAESGLVDHVKYFIELGSDIHEMDNNGDNALHSAVRSKNGNILEMVSFLILNGANRGHKNKKGETPLHTAVFEHEVLPETFDLLCGKMVPSANDKTSKECSDLIDSLCDINALTHDGSSVLFYAIMGKRTLNLIKELISRGADWKHKCNHNSTALLLAAQHGLFDHVKHFIELGLDIHEMDNDGENALHCAVVSKTGDVMEMVAFLILKGANKWHNNKEGKTPYMVAVEEGIKDASILNALQTAPGNLPS